ncbi:hypothetical protein [Mycolicibacterium sp. P1-5]|uniref:hypothetical protein n=1 Tax=Mycolicibacterium sp. P1-5 TaxID=2024617 RepID=UPI0011ECB508|nr:hypothetical protein [Mycolicibacterium sp. P1-5]KAA0112139.1 hypothetical protein CIW47_02630 [Mycolicibacterium sp. P1-5]
MLSAVVLTPSAPVLVPELAGAASADVAEFRAAAVAAAAELPDCWIAVGVGVQDQVIGSDTRGTFAGYGVDVPVALSPDAAAALSTLPLCALFTGWVRGQANPNARAQVRVYNTEHDAATAIGHGRELRAEIEAADGPVGVLVVADGANTLTPPAPGGYDPESVPVQAALDEALAAGDVDSLTRLPDGIVGRVAYQVLAGLIQTRPRSATGLVTGAPYGVGYFVGTWVPAGWSAATRELIE